MSRLKVVVFASGDGSNFEALVEASRSGILPIKVMGVICNKPEAFVLKRASKFGIRSFIVEKGRKTTREEYEIELVNCFSVMESVDLIVLAGWMLILSETFLKCLNAPIINLHPALPGKFPGAHAIESAFDAFKVDKITYTGAMVHRVIPEIDAGEVIEKIEIPIYKNDTLDRLRYRIRYFEKPLLIKAVSTFCKRLSIAPLVPFYKGKVRNMYEIGDNLLAMRATDKLSAFDRQICEIPGKGAILNQTSAWWFRNTKDVVPNHYVYAPPIGNVMIVKRAKRIDVEVVVRGYITGSTSTSLWTNYNLGMRRYCGIDFPNELSKNQKLGCAVITPTTKGKTDIPISGEEVVSMGLMTQHQWDYVSEKALELFKIGQYVANQAGLILADTKYEFGLDEEDNIILIDELHTCDSSRYWMLHNYERLLEEGKEPQCLDKDVARNWIRERCNPYTDTIPKIPKELIKKTQQAYMDFYKVLIRRDAKELMETPHVSLDDVINKYKSL